MVKVARIGLYRAPPTQEQCDIGLARALDKFKGRPTAIYAARLRMEGQLTKDELAFAMNWTYAESRKFCMSVGLLIPRGTP